MDDRLSPIAKPSPELLAAQADIRDHFQPLHGLYPAHSVAAIGVAPCRVRNALYKEWQAPVYKPRMPRGKSNERAVSRPTVSPIGHRRAQTEAHISGSSGVGDRALLEPHTKIGHRRAQTRDLGNIANMSVAELRDSTAGVDCSLVPKPLRPKSRHSPLPSVDECTLITAIDVSGSLRKSKVMSIFEQQRLGIEPPFANGMGNHHRPRSRRSTTDAPTLGSDLRPSVPPKDDDAVIYFLPSSSLMSEGPHEETTEDVPLSPTGRFSGESLSTNVGSRYVVRKPGKAQKVLGEDDVGARSMRPAHCAKPASETYDRRARFIDYENYIQSAKPLSEAEELSKQADTSLAGIVVPEEQNKRPRKGNAFARLLGARCVKELQKGH